MAFCITVEVPLLLAFFSFMLTESVYTNLIIFRTCYVTLGYNKSECALLGNTYNNETEELEKLVEPHAAVINMVRTTTESVFAVLLCLFIGPWSDKFGRKPVLIVSLLGYSMMFLCISIFSYFSNMSPWYSVICSIPVLITGGGSSFLTVILSYITDISNEETRGVRMAVFEVVLAAGILLGNISSSYWFYATNYISVFTLAAVLCTLSVLYTILFIPESLQNMETQGKLRGFFQISNVVDVIKTAVKKRENFKRAIILSSVVILSFYIFSINGDNGIMFLYLREKFDWTLTKYTLYSSATNVIWIIGTITGTFLLHKLLKVKEAVLLLVGFISIVIAALLQGLARSDWYIYTAGVVRCLGGIISPMTRSLVSKLVPADEIGKIFSMIMASEFMLSLGASPLYTAVYNATIDSDPGAFNYLTAGIYSINVILAIAIITMQRRNAPAYDQIINEENEDTSETDHTIN
ncbi:hypothetical protein NQ314_015038 [Rhamnusium bicolor]|uniref:Major facilitator superfamily (MFS) profile domain-containing protein n=1 Tax=Rhamnusium bicolor TaxID=1586634 RepID=A0AAV8X0E8_9CUCU|nr:hypothetical protein NQ314_015038 [Rhamnusium bicolor]